MFGVVITKLFFGLVMVSILTVGRSFTHPSGTTRLRNTFKYASSNLAMTRDQNEIKKMVGYKAVDDYVTSGMSIGLGTGSTAYYMTERIGQKLKSGELQNIICIPSSERTKEQAMQLGIPLTTLSEKSRLDISIDGADDVDRNLNLIKGAGGSLLRDKMVYSPIVSDKFICIVDESKLGKGLGLAAPLPVEITPFCFEHTQRVIEKLPSLQGCKAVLRMGSISNTLIDGTDIAVTDNGNYIVDLYFSSAISDPVRASKELTETPGVLEHGLFIGMTSVLLVGGRSGDVRIGGSQGEKPWW